MACLDGAGPCKNTKYGNVPYASLPLTIQGIVNETCSTAHDKKSKTMIMDLVNDCWPKPNGAVTIGPLVTQTTQTTQPQILNSRLDWCPICK